MNVVLDITYKLLRFVVDLYRKNLNWLLTIEKNLFKDRINAVHKSHVIESTRDHNMSEHPDEEYYKYQYWYWIKKYLDENLSPQDGCYLDLGCGQGRITTSIADWCGPGNGTVIGVDFSEHAIKYARIHAEKNQLKNTVYHVSGIDDYIESSKGIFADGIIMLEVSFYWPEFEDCLSKIVNLLKSGGLLFITFRPQYFYALLSVKNRNWEDVNTVINHEKGRLQSGDGVLTWQSRDKIVKLLQEKMALNIMGFRGIGPCSGLLGDPLDSIVVPSHLTKSDRDKLMDLEIHLSESVPDSSRYVLCIARKP